MILKTELIYEMKIFFEAMLILCNEIMYLKNSIFPDLHAICNKLLKAINILNSMNFISLKYLNK